MVALTLLEFAGVPLILSWLAASPLPIESRLAVIFLLSNLLPALTLSPVLGTTQRLLKSVFRKEPAPAPGQAKFIRPSALDDPSTALDLLQRELTRLLRFVPAQQPEDDTNPAFENLSNVIEAFINKLSSVGNLTETQAGTLHLLRAELSTIRHIEDAATFFLKRFAEIRGAINEAAATAVQSAYTDTLNLAIRAADQREPDIIAKLRDKPAKKPALEREADSPQVPPAASAVKEEFHMFLWSTRRLGKILERLPLATAPSQPE